MSAYCGTERGWNQHKADNERPCKWCIKAVTKPAPVVPEVKVPAPPKPYVSRAKPGAYPGGKAPAECGTAPGYQRHRKNNEDCEPCRLAANARRKEFRKKSWTRGPGYVPLAAR